MKRIQKPIGLYVTTILIVIAAGILPFLGALLQIRNADGHVPFTLVFISLLLPVFSAASAIFAFTGYNEGRIAVLICVSLNFLWWVFLAIIKVANSDAEALDGTLLLIALIRPIVFFAVFWWYFTKKDVVAYFKQDK